jgi:hypothetical protein
MGLSVVQSLLIGGGKAADVIRASDIRKSKEYNDAFNNFIDNNVGALKKASAKQSLLTNRMKKDISQIINTYLTDRTDISDKVKTEIANTIYASHGYKLDNVNSDVKSRLQNFLLANPQKSAKDFNYVDAYITNTKNIKSDRTLDQIAKKNAQEIAPMPVLDLKAKAAGLGRYKESAFFSPDTGKIEQDLLSATGYKPDEEIAEGPTVQTAGPVADEMELLRAGNLRRTAENTLLQREKLVRQLETGEFDTNQINKLYNFQLGLAYNKQGLKVGQDAEGTLKPNEFGPRTENAQKDSFEFLVNRIINAKKPVKGDAYISSQQVRNDLGAIGKNIPLAAKIGQEKKDGSVFELKDRIVGRIYQNKDDKTNYIYLGLGIPDIILG